MLDKIHIEILLNILSLLDVEDIYRVRRTSTFLSEVTCLRPVWRAVFSRHLLYNGIPVPSCGPGDWILPRDIPKLPSYIAPRHVLKLSSEELEWATLFARQMTESWSSEVPRPIVRARVVPYGSTILFYDFLRISSTTTKSEDEGDDGRYLAQVIMGTRRLFNYVIWDCKRSRDEEMSYFNPVLARDARIAKDLIWPRGILSIDLYGLDDEDAMEFLGDNPRGACLFAVPFIRKVSSDEPNILTISLFSPPAINYLHPGGFQKVSHLQFEHRMILLAMKDRRIIFQSKTDTSTDTEKGTGRMFVRDWVAGWTTDEDHEEKKVFGRNVELKPSQHGKDQRVISVKIVYDWILVFREKALEMYFFPPWLLDPVQSLALCGSMSESTSKMATDSFTLQPSEPMRMEPAIVHNYQLVISNLAFSERYSWEHEQAQEICRQCNGKGNFCPIPPDFQVEERKSTFDTLRVTCACLYRPLSIAVRFDTYFRHFVFAVNPLYSPSALVSSLSLLNITRDHRRIVFDIRQNAPYVESPILAHTQPSGPMGSNQASMRMGAFGTLLWVEAEGGSEEQSSENSDEHYDKPRTNYHIAGRRLPLPNSVSSTRGPIDTSNFDEEFQRLPLTEDPALPEPPLPSAESSTSDMAVDDSKNLQKWSVPTTTYFIKGVRDGWDAFAMNERSARIATSTWEGQGQQNVWRFF